MSAAQVRRVVVVPSTPLLLPPAGQVDPVADLRACALEAVAWLWQGRAGSVPVLAAPQRQDNVARGVTESTGARVGRSLLATVGADAESVVPLEPGEETGARDLLVVGNGSAARTEKAPAHLDPRAADFDAALGTALGAGDRQALAGLDVGLASELWCHDAPVFRALAHLAAPVEEAHVDLADDPFGVQYWVVRWRCAS